MQSSSCHAHHCPSVQVPTVVRALPDLLLPPLTQCAQFQGVPLTKPRFEERRGAADATARPAVRACQRWDKAVQALTQLARWLRIELGEFRKKVALWDSEAKVAERAGSSGPPPDAGAVAGAARVPEVKSAGQHITALHDCDT